MDFMLALLVILCLALLAIVVLALSGDTLALRLARWAFLAGLILFCGSLYGSVLVDLSTRLAPAGGVALMLGWAAIVAHAWVRGGQ